MQTRRLSILGTGLLGGSIGLAVKNRISGCQITGYSNRPESLQSAVQRGVIDIAADSIAGAIIDADLIIMATPIGAFESLLGQIAKSVQPAAIVTDVGSTKRSVMAAAKRLLPPGIRFVGSHPMAGGEKAGVEHARASLLEGAVCLITPDAGTDPKALAVVEDFWTALGMRINRLSPDAHDQLTAWASHLPHALAAALVTIQSPASLSLAARGFADTTRVAAGDPQLWSDILLDNRDHLLNSLGQLSGELHRLTALLEGNDPDSVRQWLQQAADIRRQM